MTSKGFEILSLKYFITNYCPEAMYSISWEVLHAKTFYIKRMILLHQECLLHAKYTSSSLWMGELGHKDASITLRAVVYSWD